MTPGVGFGGGEPVELQVQTAAVCFQVVVPVEERLDLHASKWLLIFFMAFSMRTSSALPTMVSFCCGKSMAIL